MKIKVEKYTNFIIKVGYFEFTLHIPEDINYPALRNSVLHELEKLDITDKSAVATKIVSLILSSK